MAHNNSNNFGGPIDIPSSSNNNKSTPVFSRRGSLSSSFALATSPGAFASAGNPFLNPISPSSHQTFNTTPPTNLSTSHPTPSSSSSPPSHGILGRRFSVGFNPHPQMVPSSQDNHGSTTATAGGLFRKFSIGGGGGGRDRNGTEDLHQPKPQPHSSIFATLQSNQHKDSFEQQHKQDHKTTVQQLKAPENQDKNSRSSSPMRSMILNGQMLD
ncbi:hypothetical protein MVEG_07906 [Podila verticillata NRRL 6337]|nr:hypothetical protein MVEG_07906 [Podila verticillata NRRL 6337]